MGSLRPAQITLAVFVLSFGFIWWLAGNRLILTNDEGIFLSHAARIAEGEVLYRDLFGLTGPASYWLLALAFKIGGVSIASAHFILAAQIAILTSIVFYVTRELSDGVSALICAFVFLVFNAADPAMMTNNHRWDADTYALCGIVAIWRGRTFLGGVLLAMSVWATPILAITAVTATFAAILLKHSPWRVIAGGAVGALGGTVALAISGGLGAFIQNLLWMKSNYSDANQMGYGAVIGGYPALFEGASGGFEYGMRVFIVAGLTLPVWLPVLCGVLVISNHDRNRRYFFICAVSMIAAVSPRFDVGHLVFAVPLFYPIAASFIPRARWTVVPIGALALMYLFSTILQRSSTVLIDTPAGQVRTDSESAEIVQWLTANIKPGERIFVYPYPPIAYLLTRAKNVSRFCVLQPGLFTAEDERLAVEDMIRHPPEKVLNMKVSKEELLRIWPASDPSRLQLNHLHNFVVTNFEPAARFRSLQIYTPRRAPLALAVPVAVP
jgi:hypothetical protein